MEKTENIPNYYAIPFILMILIGIILMGVGNDLGAVIFFILALSTVPAVYPDLLKFEIKVVLFLLIISLFSAVIQTFFPELSILVGLPLIVLLLVSLLVLGSFFQLNIALPFIIQILDFFNLLNYIKPYLGIKRKIEILTIKNAVSVALVGLLFGFIIPCISFIPVILFPGIMQTNKFLSNWFAIYAIYSVFFGILLLGLGLVFPLIVFINLGYKFIFMKVDTGAKWLLNLKEKYLW